ncbi:hypothetical protein JXB12_03835 [candidate division KSB1 bacterium]|nr:hypothetical protein [candidate division KSB1 bacterium]
MMTRLGKYVTLCLSLLFLGATAFPRCVASQDSYYSAVNNSRVRPIALGGAFTSVEDDIESIFYNPGSFSMYNYPKDAKVTVFLNPMMSLLAFQHYSDNFSNKIQMQDLLNASALLVKSVVLSIKQFETGIVIGEESFDNVYHNKKSQFFAYNDLWNDNASTLFLKLKLAQRVSIGVNGTYYQRRKNDTRETGIGFSYGILLKPNNRMNVGLSYIDLPNKMAEFRNRLERLFDETMNIGVSYKILPGTMIAVDIRNLTEEIKENVRELHLGLEQRIFRIVAIRGGYYKKRFSDEEIYSAGIGLFDSNLLFSEENRFNHHNFMIDYSFVYEQENRWHLFSLVWHF